MTLSQVHHTQQVYRKVLDAMSRPGNIVHLDETDSALSDALDCFSATASLLFTLLDQEVTFHLISEDSVNIATMITAYTLARQVSVEEADFIIVLADAEQEKIEQALQRCKVGTLRDPHLSTTWMMETEVLAEGNELRLTGPGIETEATLQLNVDDRFWDIRREKISEFPLGIDIIFTNDHREVACMPRTTNVERVEMV